MFFKCKNCGGNTVYSPETHSMYCPYCDSLGSDERKETTGSDLSICPNCTGEVPVEKHSAAAKCPYCDNYIIFDERIQGKYQPGMMIPFQLGKESCKNLIRERFKKCVFAPTDFLSEVRLNTIEGDYVPFWFYDYETNCDYMGEGTKVRSWTGGDMRYTETSYYSVARNMDVSFSKIPVDASEKMPDDVMDLLEPYQYDKLEAFRPEYLSGFGAEKYNMDAEAVENRAIGKRDDAINRMVKENCAGYNTLQTKYNNISVNTREANYGLLPVWKYDYKYKDKEYPFYVNGQTGKVVGMVPISKAKVWAYGGTLWACLTIIMTLIKIILS